MLPVELNLLSNLVRSVAFVGLRYMAKNQPELVFSQDKNFIANLIDEIITCLLCNEYGSGTTSSVKWNKEC
ncbi:hypothetical protein DZ860_03040 [Vibrio sinensis]|uniref:Uncharacterized protein n=1 Tax=Vibrio sinensis TaxID=2302434 RepID=A0A3A6QYS7_9VIBR|nr:hypothetical protein DZ860_03040 [Vibrio sinensis]